MILKEVRMVRVLLLNNRDGEQSSTCIRGVSLRQELNTFSVDSKLEVYLSNMVLQGSLGINIR